MRNSEASLRRRVVQSCEADLTRGTLSAVRPPDGTFWACRPKHVQWLLREPRSSLDRVKLGHVALGGTKVQANASVHKAMSYARMREAEKKLAAEVSAWFVRAEATDAADDREHGAERRGDEMPDWVANKAACLERIRAARVALEAEAKALPPDGDEGPGPLLGHDGADQPAATRYNAQIAVDGANQIIISQRVQTSPVRRAVPQATPHPPGMSEFRTSHRRAMDAYRREQRRTARRWPLSACVGSGGEQTTGGRRPARSDRVRQRISAWGGSVAGVERGALSDPGLARSRIRRALRCNRGPDAQFRAPGPGSWSSPGSASRPG